MVWMKVGEKQFTVSVESSAPTPMPTPTPTPTQERRGLGLLGIIVAAGIALMMLSSARRG